MSGSGSLLARAVTAALVVAGLVASASAQSAGAADLESVRAHAQSVADEATDLERRAQALDERRSALDERIVRLSGEIGALESKINSIGHELAAARDLYIERAVEAYKSGTPGTRLDMLLAAETMAEFFAVAEINSVAVALDTKRLQELEGTRVDIEMAQDSLDERKQEQIESRAEVEALDDEIATTLDDRRARLRALAAEVEELERQVRREARLARPPDATAPPSSTVATGDIPDGYVSTGVTFGGVASWYGPGFAGNLTANGEIYDPMGLTAASKELPFNTLLFVSYQGRGVVVRINDRGPYVGDRIIDLSQGAAQTIGMSGIGWVDATIVVKS
ncbi:MAG: septal ring lytic transglycosylase RlpA family protein [Actinomycetota bacterium]